MSLRNQSFKEFETIVVDDGSTDGTELMIKTEFPEVIFLRTTGNLFWTGTVNVGIKFALQKDARYFLTLNNDTLLPEGFLDNMVRWSLNRPNAVMGALEFDAVSRKAHYGGERVSWLWHRTTYLLDILKAEEQNGIHKASHCWGRGLFIPRHILDEVGLFCEKIFPHYYADCDFTRIAISKGFEVYYNYDAPIYTYPEESGQSVIRTNKNLKNYYNHLFSIKGAGNLRDFTLYACRNCPLWCLPTHLLIGYVRRIGGYWIK